MAGASIGVTLELWASSLRDVKERIRPLFTQERVAASAGAFLDCLLGLREQNREHAERIAAVLTVYDKSAVEYLDRHDLKRGIELANYYASETLRPFDASSIRAELRRARDFS